MVPRGDASRQTMMFVQNRGHRLSTHLCPKPHSEKGDDPTRRIGKQGPGLSAGWLKLQGRTVALAGLSPKKPPTGTFLRGGFGCEGTVAYQPSPSVPAYGTEAL